MKTKKPALEKGLTIGLDLGDRQHHACVLDAAGEIRAEEVIANTREVLTAFCGRYPGATVVMETGAEQRVRSWGLGFRIKAIGSHKPQDLTPFSGPCEA